MRFKTFTANALLLGTLVCGTVSATSACKADGSQNNTTDKSEAPRHKVGGPQLGSPGGGPAIDKSGDSTLQAMIRDIVPQFKQLTYTDAQTGKSMKYNLFTPSGAGEGVDYPLVLFTADASTPGEDFTRPLTQGYGALVWATPAWQAAHPCFVLVPQYSGVAVNDAYEHTDEVDIVLRLVKEFAANNSVDSSRLYTTGQSMGGMISMYYNITYPDVFAASIFVDCHWDTSKFDQLAKSTITYITAGKNGSSFGNIKAVEDAVTADGRRYAFAEWSAKLPQAEQDSLASALLAEGAPVNIINFSPKSVLPDDGKGSEHMYSFDYAYRLTPVREWLFMQSK